MMRYTSFARESEQLPTFGSIPHHAFPTYLSRPVILLVEGAAPSNALLKALRHECISLSDYVALLPGAFHNVTSLTLLLPGPISYPRSLPSRDLATQILQCLTTYATTTAPPASSGDPTRSVPMPLPTRTTPHHRSTPASSMRRAGISTTLRSPASRTIS